MQVDFIGKYENLESDYLYVCDKLGINSTLLKINTSNRDLDYRQYYTDESRCIVGEYYKEDVSLFKYSF